MKKCKECGVEKCESLFYGVQNECKECTKARVARNQRRVGDTYDSTEKGVVRVIYKTQKRNNKLRGYGCIPYSKPELSEWMHRKGFKSIYDNWIESGKDKDLKPSVDRLDDFKGYSLDNIRLGTWLENRQHQHRDILNGVGTSGARCKPLYKFDDEFNIIESYVSYSQAVRSIGYSLEYQIKKKVKCRSGFYWSYSKDFKQSKRP